jgi:hypothetical protein
MKRIIIASILIALTSCWPQFGLDDHKLLLINHSNATVYYELSYLRTLREQDVSYIPKVPFLKLSNNDSIRPAFVRYGSGGWKYMINKFSRDSSLHIFFFIVDTVNKYGWKSILKMNKFDRKEMTTVQLDSLKWVYDYRK